MRTELLLECAALVALVGGYAVFTIAAVVAFFTTNAVVLRFNDYGEAALEAAIIIPTFPLVAWYVGRLIGRIKLEAKG